MLLTTNARFLQFQQLMECTIRTYPTVYAVEAYHSRSLEKSLRFSVTRTLMQIFKTRSSEIVMECQNYLGFYTIPTLTRKRESNVLIHAGKFAE